MRKQGFTKMRIDGEIQNLVDKMQVDRFKIHDIELVIDRMEVEEDLLDRIKAAINTAFKMGNGQLTVSNLVTNKAELLSKTLMCSESGISYDEPSPNSFSFNSPYGACPTCKGMGMLHSVNEALLIPDENLSIHKGGLKPLGIYKDNYAFSQMKALAKKYKFSLDEPIKKLPKPILKIILHGSGEDKITSTFESFGTNAQTSYEGLVPQLKRYYEESTSEGIRRWAEEYMELSECIDCGGTRLKKESLFFKINEKNIADLSKMDLDELFLKNNYKLHQKLLKN
jgi:excinuclease ABC subunit A